MRRWTALLPLAGALAYPSCYDGHYRDAANADGDCPGFSQCPPGTYCVATERFECPAGRFGSSWGLVSSDCDGECPAGHYCPEGTVTPVECDDAATYCPAGSSAPLQVPEGYYSVDFQTTEQCQPGTYCADGVQRDCPAGSFGAAWGAADAACDGECAAGYHCPAGTVHPIQCLQAHYFCPAGSGARQDVHQGYYSDAARAAQQQCEPGHYCVGGERFECAAGRYGAAWGAVDAACDGECAAGYYCPAGSSAATQEPCGGEEWFCPADSAAPTAVAAGSVTTGGAEATRKAAETCLAGHYCDGDGVMAPCPAGRYGASSGLTDAACSGECPAGHYCPEGTVEPVECDDAATYCPLGSAWPLDVPWGYHSVDYQDIELCQPGTFCLDGVQASCPQGRYGATVNITDPLCDGPCSAGWYCPEGSVSPAQAECGGRHVFCPEGSAAPTLVAQGNYSAGGFNDSTHTHQLVAPAGEFAIDGVRYACPRGRYGGAPGLQSRDCDGPCAAGYYCDAASTLATQHECGGPTLVCAEGSFEPAAVPAGHYTYVDGDACPPGQWRNWSLSEPANGYPSPEATAWTTPACELCPDGTFKPQMGDSADLCLPCPAWSADSSADRRTCDCRRLPGGEPFTRLVFNDSHCLDVPEDYAHAPSPLGADALFTLEPETVQECEPGHYCVDGVRYECPAGTYGASSGLTDPACDGPCAEGHYCPAASVSPAQHECGRADGVCAEGSSEPQLVAEGYYTPVGVDALAQAPEDVVVCPAGAYCVGMAMFACPSGTFGSSEGLTDAACSGECPAGYYCPEGTVDPVECGGADVFCPEGSAAPTAVAEGFATLPGDGGANATQSEQRVCQSGHYCVGGVEHMCPPGVFGWQRGLTSPACDGPCSEGYYCPSYPWDDPSRSSTRFECGGSHLFCPAGSSAPAAVDAGYYSRGGPTHAANATRAEQRLCPAGWFCIDGRVHPCPAGYYGGREGETRARCEGLCPPGHACPLASAAPEPCANGTYATGGAAVCAACPGALDGEQECWDSRRCCLA